MTSLGFEPATFLLVVYLLDQLRYRVLPSASGTFQKTSSCLRRKKKLTLSLCLFKTYGEWGYNSSTFCHLHFPYSLPPTPLGNATDTHFRGG
jgi:hypothetical protein